MSTTTSQRRASQRRALLAASHGCDVHVATGVVCRSRCDACGDHVRFVHGMRAACAPAGLATYGLTPRQRAAVAALPALRRAGVVIA